MVRIRLGERVFVVKSVCGYPALRRIDIYEKDDRHLITLESSQRVDELMAQACERGFIDFSKEKFKYDFK